MLISLDQLNNSDIVIGEFLSVVVVNSTNVVKDVFAGFKDAVGGRMKIYEDVIQSAVETALKELEQKAKELDYDGVIGVKIASPTIANGGAEVVVYGNGFRFKNKPKENHSNCS